MKPFAYDALPGRVVFGAGRRAELGDEVRRLDAARVLLIAGAHEQKAANEVSAALGDLLAGRWNEVRQHVPVELVERARSEVGRCRADLSICLGGGSAIGLAKALARDGGPRLVAVPTTYSGSEMTPIWGTTEQSHKTTGRDVAVLARTVVYDPELTVSLPPQLSCASGMNAMAHCVEALYAPGANPVITVLALEGARHLIGALPDVAKRPDDLAARSDALYGAYLAGAALAVAGTSFHHKLCHLLGGRYDLPHAELHAAVLPHSLALVERRIPLALAPLAAVLGTPSAAEGIYDLAERLPGHTSVSALGLTRHQLDEVVPDVVTSGLAEPYAATEDEVAAFFETLYENRRPSRVEGAAARSPARIVGDA